MVLHFFLYNFKFNKKDYMKIPLSNWDPPSFARMIATVVPFATGEFLQRGVHIIILGGLLEHRDLGRAE